mmetsp:Transcript_120108/g.346997  ORF Transcript_120108/g.346997 Transcript_120108/m.346997 type:complete len:235 (+) Transcript_120108:1-705(+)
MGAKASMEECTSTDNPRVRDCCHLEGETPIEIRIAYQHPRPSAQPVGFDPAALRTHQATAFGVAGAAYRHGGSSGSNRWPPASADAEKPSMPRGAERLRLPPPPGSTRAPSRTGEGDQGHSGDFDAETFAAPPDSERSEVSATPGRMVQPVALQVLQLSEDGYFPEVVRATRHGAGTFREVSSSHRDSQGGDPRELCVAPCSPESAGIATSPMPSVAPTVRAVEPDTPLEAEAV